jgi:hypothetical protein
VSTVGELMHRNLIEVFNERDAERRRAAIERTYAEDVVFHDPEGSTAGRAAIDGKVQALLDGAPGFVFAARGRTYESAGSVGVLAWQFGPEGGEPVVTGIDVALVRDGLIQALHTALDPVPGGGEQPA